MNFGFIKKRKNDNSGIQTRVWGPAGWIFLHSIAQNYPWDPTDEQKLNYYTFFKTTGNVLPCRYCRESYQKFIEEPGTKLSMDTMKNRKTLFIWLYRVHNKINKKLEIKGVPTAKEVWNKYESFRSKCHKTPEKVEKLKKGCTDPMRGYRKKCVIDIIHVDEHGNHITRFGKKIEKEKPEKKRKDEISEE